MTDLRKLANGRICMVRLPGICDGRTDSVVLAHYRLTTLAGTALKPHDLIGAYACQRCHDVCDGRVPRPPHVTREDVRLWHAEGVLRTLDVLIREGIISNG